jgi:hypothetical protein
MLEQTLFLWKALQKEKANRIALKMGIKFHCSNYLSNSVISHERLLLAKVLL